MIKDFAILRAGLLLLALQGWPTGDDSITYGTGVHHKISKGDQIFSSFGDCGIFSIEGGEKLLAVLFAGVDHSK
ncbi:MAG TPA: hypothetical protein PKD72_06880 [Gemmatales bacterium]|nr:hypothetical protein [Gemmatales bacterium]